MDAVGLNGVALVGGIVTNDAKSLHQIEIGRRFSASSVIPNSITCFG